MNLHRLSYYILPGTCIACGLSANRFIDLCTHCEELLPVLGHTCLYCAEPIPVDQYRCAACLGKRPPFSGSICLFRYEWPVNRLITNFKEHGRLAIGKVFAQLFLADKYELLKSLSDEQTIIVPVPLHPQKLRKRGFNQAELIAHEVAIATGNPLRIDLLERTSHSTEQKATVSTRQRQQNVANAFNCGSILRGKRVLLVDDVMTTGATVSAATKVLLQAEADDVIVLALARTPLVHDSTPAIMC